MLARDAKNAAEPTIGRILPWAAGNEKRCDLGRREKRQVPGPCAASPSCWMLACSVNSTPGARNAVVISRCGSSGDWWRLALGLWLRQSRALI